MHFHHPAESQNCTQCGDECQALTAHQWREHTQNADRDTLAWQEVALLRILLNGAVYGKDIDAKHDALKNLMDRSALKIRAEYGTLITREDITKGII